MTRGIVVVLGPHGRNLGAGMTGGEAFVLDPDERLVNGDLVGLEPLDQRDRERLVGLLERHVRATGSARAAALLERIDDALGRFRRVVPRLALAAAEPAGEEVAAAGSGPLSA
jgi:glutamate synthase (NADPH/NADH) large chain